MTKHSSTQFAVHRVHVGDSDAAWEIIQEYYEAVGVVARDSKEDFQRLYFHDGAGVWSATIGGGLVGSIALRPLAHIANAGEVKRLYVRPTHRGSGIAKALYQALELYAREFGYLSLYLDTTDEMLAAQRFYADLGFQTISRYNDNPQATIFMRKAIQVSSK
jgi:GNAT superfamily N-acetyltransferase